MIRRQCTAEYKIQVCERTTRRDVIGIQPRQRMPKDVTVHQYFGISTDEAARAERVKTRFAKLKWTRPVYPLLDLGWSRKDCLAYLKDRVPHPACVFCPFKTNQAWAELKATDPDGCAGGGCGRGDPRRGGGMPPGSGREPVPAPHLRAAGDARPVRPRPERPRLHDDRRVYRHVRHVKLRWPTTR